MNRLSLVRARGKTLNAQCASVFFCTRKMNFVFFFFFPVALFCKFVHIQLPLCGFENLVSKRLLCCHYRDADTQTKRESSTNVPKPSTFVAGLRGCNSTKTTMNVVDLTVDVDQT